MLRDPAVRRELRKELDRIWLLGRSLVVGWRIVHSRLALLLIPNAHLQRMERIYATLPEGDSRLLEPKVFDAAARRFGLDVVIVERPHFEGEIDAAAAAAIDRALRRYSVWFTPRRPVALVDIVAFSRATRIAQAALLNSLAFSFAIAQRRFRQFGLRLDLGRSTTGDGFYVWNRHVGAHAEADLFALLLVALADNRLSVAAGESPAPRLRAGFTVGGHFSFYLPDGEGERERDYIVGDATIALARMLEGAAPRQILLGTAAVPPEGPDRLVAGVQARLDRLAGVPLLDGRVESMRLRLSGGASPLRRRVRDKHGFAFEAYNARVDVSRAGESAVSLGARGRAARLARARR